MKFEKLLATFDMGVCADQVQREALLELVLLFVNIDGVESPEEVDFVADWLNQVPWNSDMTKQAFYTQAQSRVASALECGDVEAYIKQRASVLVNSPAKGDTLQLIEQLVSVDGHVDDKEQQGLAYLQKLLQ